MKFLFITFFSILYVQLTLAQEHQIEMILVESGSFQMGITGSIHRDELPVHSVTLKSYYIGRYETTIKEYSKFCFAVGIKAPFGDSEMPAYGVTWQQAVQYANWMSDVNGLDRAYEIIKDKKKFLIKYISETNGYRLPTEAEWEYAAGGGDKTKHYAYSGSNTVSEVAWNLLSGNKIHKVGQKKPNELGIFDMSGNCMEWCWDYYSADYYSKSSKENPTGPKNSATRVCRGGNFKSSDETVRINRRVSYEPNYKDEAMGFRLARNQ